ncbi:MAG: hypothetical protein H0W69_08735, partial [Gemmatimonadaceae bacterium]|nr:hypothetical protein [Gemmatimonadaceae bacterium]
PISKEAIPSALEKAERYRLLNHSWAAESICLDVLAIDPENQDALLMLVLSLSDRLEEGQVQAVAKAREHAAKIRDDYQRAYHSGIIAERRGQGLMTRGGMGAGAIAYEAFKEAMDWYAKAEAIRPAGNDDSILRWNTCVRILERRTDLAPGSDHPYEPALED